MWLTAFASMTLAVATVTPDGVQRGPHPPYKQTLEYMAWPEQARLVYVMGALDGIVFTVVNSNAPDRAIWLACIRKTTVDAILHDVDKLLVDNPSYQTKPVAYAISNVVGALQPC